VRLLRFSKTAPLFSSFSLLLLAALLTVPNANSALSSFSWLKPGAYAVYEFQATLGVGFDDHAWAWPVRGNYSWQCLEKNETHTVLDVQVNVEVFKRPERTTPGKMRYFGIEFYIRAADGDLSFIKRAPMDQVIGRLELFNSTDWEYYEVSIPSPLLISDRFRVVVDLDTMMMIGQDGKPWGRWIMWINPFRYPLEGRTEELFVMNWLNTTINLNVTYISPQHARPIDTVLGEVKSYFTASASEPIENKFLAELGLEGDIIIFVTYHYEARTGILIGPTADTYLDDVLTQKFGIIRTDWDSVDKGEYYESLFRLNQTNISLEDIPSNEQSGLDFAPYLPYLIIPAAAIITVAYLIHHKKTKQQNHMPTKQ
jgi:hypothetical protein